MPIFRHRPIDPTTTIEARQYSGENAAEFTEWANAYGKKITKAPDRNVLIVEKYGAPDQVAGVHDWVVRQLGENGSTFWVMAEGPFVQTYERI